MYKHGYDIVDGNVVQKNATELQSLTSIPDCMSYITALPVPEIRTDNILITNFKPLSSLFELDKIYAYNTTSGRYTAAADVNHISGRMPITTRTTNGNWVNGISKLFTQTWRLKDNA